MKTRPNRRRLLLAALLLFVVTIEICLFIFMRDALRETIILPLANLIYTLIGLLRSVDQIIYWILMVLIGMITLIIFAAEVIQPSTKPSPNSPPPHNNSRFRSWQRYLTSFQNSNFAGENLAYEISRLITTVYAHHEDLSPAEVIRMGEDGRLKLPPQISSLLRSRKFVIPSNPPNWLEKKLSRWQPRKLSSSLPNPAQAEVEQIIAFIEQELEVSRETDVNP